MSVLEREALDMAAILTNAYEIGDLINASKEVTDYLYWKQQVEKDENIRNAVLKFERKKQLYDECQRFGHYHPSYHAALEEVKAVEKELEGFEAVRRFKAAEERLDKLLYSVSETIARSVSETIKVPSNDPLPTGGCGSGGSCSGACG